MDEYSIEWFRWCRDNHPEWLGTQAHKLLEYYEQLERALETYRERHRDAKSNFATIQRLRIDVKLYQEFYAAYQAKEAAEMNIVDFDLNRLAVRRLKKALVALRND